MERILGGADHFIVTRSKPTDLTGELLVGDSFGDSNGQGQRKKEEEIKMVINCELIELRPALTKIDQFPTKTTSFHLPSCIQSQTKM